MILRVCTVEERIQTPPALVSHLLRWMSLDLPERCPWLQEDKLMVGLHGVFFVVFASDLFLKYFQLWKQEKWIEGSSNASLSDQQILKVVSRWHLWAVLGPTLVTSCNIPLHWFLIDQDSKFKILDFFVYWYDSPCIILVQSFYIPCITVLFPFCDHPVPGCDEAPVSWRGPTSLWMR